jgi:ATP-binding protein involved in chromosome partitioning
MADQLTDEAIMSALSLVKDPEIGRDLVSLGMVRSVDITGSAVAISVELTTPACPLKATIESDINDRLTELGAESVSVEWLSNVKRSFSGPTAELIPGVRNTIAVASGKGGVGKTTVAVNLAVSLAREGARVGLLDADITGPNVPLMMGTQDGHVTGAAGRVSPVARHGVTMMSIQYFLTGDAPVIWRGPLIHSAIQQFLRDVDWGELDYLVIDLPPGTGDAALSLAQLIPLSGAVIVTTPQEASLMDAR